MTSDSDLFKTALELNEDGAWPARLRRFGTAAGEWLPLFEGKSIQIYNHRYASIVTPIGSVSGQGQSIYSTEEQLNDPSYIPTP